jgi:hypothetical protein
MKPAVVLCVALTACAGRAPDPVQLTMATDSMMDCYAIKSELAANNVKGEELASEQGWKVAQNVAAGVAGVVIWPLWFGMDFQGAARKEATALKARQQYLMGLAAKKNCTDAWAPQPLKPRPSQSAAASTNRVAR